MLSFLKQQSYLIFRCVAIQIGMTMFGLVLSMATLNNSSLQLVVGIFSAIFYLYLLADAAFSVGIKERAKVVGGRAVAEYKTGLFASLCANAINLGLAIAIWIGFFLSLGSGATPAWASACKMVAAFIQGMYSGIIGTVNSYVSDSSLMSALIYTLIVLPSPIVCAVAYYCGTKGVYIVPGYRSNNQENG